MLNQFRQINYVLMVCWLCISLVVLQIPGTPVSAVQAQEDFTEQLNQAEQYYNTGRFDEAESLLEESLEKGTMEREQKLRAYRLLGLTYIAKDFENEARGAVQKLLEMVPNYTPDPTQDPPPFRDLVAEVRGQQAAGDIEETAEPAAEEDLESLVQEEQQKKDKRKWYYIAGGAVVGVAVIAAVALGGGGGGSPEFPMPPGRP